MALHILNCSIDSPDPLPECISEDLSINDIESISELIIEDFLGFENAIAEHDEQDNANGYSFEFAKIILYIQATTLNMFSHQSLLDLIFNGTINYAVCYYSQFNPDIVSPPPQTA
jgi:hypothetical protein